MIMGLTWFSKNKGEQGHFFNEKSRSVFCAIYPVWHIVELVTRPYLDCDRDGFLWNVKKIIYNIFWIYPKLKHLRKTHITSDLPTVLGSMTSILVTGC